MFESCLQALHAAPLYPGDLGETLEQTGAHGLFPMSEADGTTTVLASEHASKCETSPASPAGAGAGAGGSSVFSLSSIPYITTPSGIRCPRFPVPGQEASPAWAILSTGGGAPRDAPVAAKNASPEMDLDIPIPLAASTRAERISRIADWTTPNDGPHAGASYRRGFVRSTAPKAAGGEESGWSVTAELKAPTTRDRRGGSFASGLGPSAGGPSRSFGGGPSGRFTGGGGRQGGPPGTMANRRGGGRGPRFGDRVIQRKRDPSILVEPTWKIVEEIEFSRLSKLQLDPDDAVAVETLGRARAYDVASDKIGPKTERSLLLTTAAPARYDKIPPIEDDALMWKLAAEHGAVVLAPDHVASILMAATRAVNPWDILAKRKGSTLILDKRPSSLIDLLPVNETSPDSPPDAAPENINSSAALTLEASRINLHLPQALSKPDSALMTLGSQQSSVSGGEYCLRYSKIDLGDGVVVLVRSVISAVSGEAADLVPISFTTLLEYEHKGVSGADWRSRLDTQLGAVFAKEIRNNGSLLARAAFQSLLSAVDTIKVAYVSRVNSKDATRHGVLSVHTYDPYELAQQMNLNVPNAFGILRALIDFLRNLSEGEFTLMRDPNKPLLRIYETSSGPTNELEETINDLVSAGPELLAGGGSAGETDSE